MKRPDPEALDVSRWPSIDIYALGQKAREHFQQRATAIQQYTLGLPISEVESQTKLDRRTLYRTIERALQAHPDGRPWGFRALVPGAHTRPYQRRKQSRAKGRGLAGSFAQLLDEYPELEKLVRTMIESREVLLTQKGDRIWVKNLRAAHNRFTTTCRSVGLAHGDYPLNQDELPVGGVAPQRAAY